MNDKQAVAEKPDELAQPGSEGQGAQDDDLDSLLSEYDYSVTKEVKGESTPKETPAQTVPKELLDFVAQQKAEAEKAEAESAKTEAVAALKDGMDIVVPDKIAWGFIHASAEEDPRIVEVFRQRREKPEAWKKVLQKLQKGLKEELSIDASATADRQSIEAAIRSASTKSSSSDEPALGQMSNAQFEAYKRGLMRKG